MKLHLKIILTHAFTIILIMTGVVVYGNTVLRPRLLREQTAGYDAYVSQLCKSASIMLSDQEQRLFALYQNVSLAEELYSGDALSLKRLRVEQGLRTMCCNNSFFSSMLAVDQAGQTFYGTSAVTGQAATLLASYESRQAELESSQNYWFADSSGQICLKMPVCFVTPLRFTGLLLAQTGSGQMMSALGMDRAMQGKTCILTREGNLLLQTEALTQAEAEAVYAYAAQTALPISRRLDVGGVPYWLTVHTDTRYGWQAAHIIPLSESLRLADSICSTGIVFCLLVSLLTIVLAVIIAHSMTRNVKALQAAMSEVSCGHFDVSVDIRSKDEIGELARHFRWMQQRLKETTDQMIRHAVEQQEAEYALLDFKYRSLQAKISPHFICNILASVSSLAQMGRQKEVTTLAVRASQYLRDNLAVEEQRFTSLRTEIRYVEEYVYLYREIYGDENTLVTQVPPELLNCRVPGMLLQPLVENAFVHCGDLLNPCIRITAARSGDWLELNVIDNGGSFSEETIRAVEEINEEHMAVDRMKGFGLRSVLQRLRLLYGENQSLTIACDPGVESRIEIRIPFACYCVPDSGEAPS